VICYIEVPFKAGLTVYTILTILLSDIEMGGLKNI